jgi:hypothetical protein
VGGVIQDDSAKPYVERVLRELASSDIIKEIGDQRYKPLPLALLFPNGSPPGDAIKLLYVLTKIAYAGFIV